MQILRNEQSQEHTPRRVAAALEQESTVNEEGMLSEITQSNNLRSSFCLCTETSNSQYVSPLEPQTSSAPCVLHFPGIREMAGLFRELSLGPLAP